MMKNLTLVIIRIDLVGYVSYIQLNQKLGFLIANTQTSPFDEFDHVRFIVPYVSVA